MALSLRRGVMRLVAVLAMLFSCIAVQAQVPAGPGSWSGRQQWGLDREHLDTLTGYAYWPAGPPVLGGKRALVLVLHGCTQSAWDDVINNTDNGFNWQGVAERYGAVIVAPDATGDVYYKHCWDYARPWHDRVSGHDGVLLDLVARFVSDARYAIDARQVYVAGLSSGGGEAMALACLAPDVFAGVGISAGPPPGTTTFQIGYVPFGFTAASAARRCKALAGSNAAAFSSQVASVIWGTDDDTVAPGYGPLDAAAMRLAYGGGFQRSAPRALAGGGSNVVHTDASGRVRTSEITVAGMGHAWPSGPGGQNTHHVDATHVDYPGFVMDFWFHNNLRVNRSATARAPCSAPGPR